MYENDKSVSDIVTTSNFLYLQVMSILPSQDGEREREIVGTRKRKRDCVAVIVVRDLFDTWWAIMSTITGWRGKGNCREFLFVKNIGTKWYDWIEIIIIMSEREAGRERERMEREGSCRSTTFSNSFPFVTLPCFSPFSKKFLFLVKNVFLFSTRMDGLILPFLPLLEEQRKSEREGEWVSATRMSWVGWMYQMIECWKCWTYWKETIPFLSHSTFFSHFRHQRTESVFARKKEKNLLRGQKGLEINFLLFPFTQPSLSLRKKERERINGEKSNGFNGLH